MGWNRFFRENGMHMSWIVAVVATFGSLFFSEVMNYAPCKLCWYQRILMYPLAIILGIAAVRKDTQQFIYVLPLSIWGMGVSLYHVLMQKTAWFKDAATTCGQIPCDVDYINWLGFITIPVLALTAFTLITLIQLALWSALRKG